METICVGDLHGDINLYHKIKSQFSSIPLTLVGDLLDSFVYTRSEQFRLIELVLNDIERGETRCVKGNHEWSYLWPERMKGSGYASSFAANLMPFFGRIYRLMPNYILEGNILITHAGLSKRLLTGATFDTPLFNDAGEIIISELSSMLEVSARLREDSILYNVGHSRGGADAVGGIFWDDWFIDFQPIEGLTQVFGHTPVSQILQKGSNYNLDCLQRKTQVLKLNTDKTIEIIDVA